MIVDFLLYQQLVWCCNGVRMVLKNRELFSYNNFLFLYVAYFQLIERIITSTE